MSSVPIRLSTKTYLYLSLFWIGFGLFTITSSYVYFIESNTPFDWVNRFISRMPIYVLWIPFIPFINYIVSKFRIENPFKLKNTFVLITTGIIIAAVHRILAVISVQYLEGLILGKEILIYNALFEQKFALFAYMFDSYIMYWIIVTVLLSIEYYRKYNENRIIAADLEKQLAQAEVSALKMQINPHFLFNTLHSISALINKNPDQADRMICLLSDLLRISLDNIGKHFVPLKTELDFLNLYLQIQKIRYKDRLNVNLTADQEVVNFKVPNLILQPIVENSIKHVLEKNIEHCTININSFIEKNKIVIKVQDNGKGIEAGIDPFSSGLGLSNVKSRLEQLYGNSHELIYNNFNGKGFEIILKLPMTND